MGDVWLEHPALPGQKIRIADGSQWHYTPGGWVETDPVPELTAADIEAAEAAAKEAPPKIEPEPAPKSKSSQKATQEES